MAIVIILFIFIIKIIFIPSDKVRTPTSEWERSNTLTLLSSSFPAIISCLKLILIIFKFLGSCSSMLTTFTFRKVMVGTTMADAAWKSGSRNWGPKPTSETRTWWRWVVVQAQMVSLICVNLLIWYLMWVWSIDMVCCRHMIVFSCRRWFWGIIPKVVSCRWPVSSTA